jgi:hypothetical protein
MKKAENSGIRLLSVKAASRDSHDSKVARDRSSGRRLMTNPKLTTMMSAMNTRKIHISILS